MNSWTAYERGVVEVCSERKGSGLYLAKRGRDRITSYFVDMRTNLIPSHSPTHAGGRMGSVG